MKKLAAFDLDGTLSQSDRFLLPAYRKALTLTGRDPLPDSLLMTLIGGTAADNARVISPDGSMETYEEFNFHVVQAIRGTIPGLARAYPGVEESLRELRRLGYKIYLCSNARREYTDLVLGQIGLLPLFDGTPEGRDGWDKPQLLAHILETERPGAAVMVGDRHFDRTAARENGVPFVGCLYGLFPTEVTGADAEVKSAGELPEAIERLTAL